tara:strand:+ start:7105 stop:8229 length:1125 start_codon:yes stop_codon:yes gene_type:complete
MRRYVPVLALSTILFLGACGGQVDAPVAGPPPAASTLPLLGAGPHVGLIYSAPAPAAQPTLDAAFNLAINNGLRGYELSIPWSRLEQVAGVIDTAYLNNLLSNVSNAGLVPYLVIPTVDTNQLALPTDLVDPGDSTQLAPGLTFDDPAIVNRMHVLLDEVVPRLVAHGGFYLSVGNEVDVWLAANPAAEGHFANFMDDARMHAQSIDTRLAVGATVTYGVIANDLTLLQLLQTASDNMAFTYYPLNPDFTVRNPNQVAGDLATMLAAVAPDPLLLQEVGYPSGYSIPTNGSSEELQRQFVQAIFSALVGQPRIRFCSMLHLADWSSAELDTFQTYYGINDPLFREYLGSLGLREHATGNAKTAWTQFIQGLNSL